MHLTNYSINKTAENFERNKGSEDDSTGHKRSLTWTLKFIDSLGHDSKEVMRNIQDIILKTLVSVQPILSHTYRSC
jgi:tubulin polyglutamylase TTLL6/13